MSVTALVPSGCTVPMEFTSQIEKSGTQGIETQLLEAWYSVCGCRLLVVADAGGWAGCTVAG